MSVSKDLLSKARTPDYVCGDFAVDAWQALLRRSLDASIISALRSANATSFYEARDYIERLDSPKDGSFVTFWRIAGRAHVGVYFKGSIFHLAHHYAQCVPLGTLKTYYPVIRFYGVK